MTDTLNGIPLASVKLTVPQTGVLEALLTFASADDFPPSDAVLDTLTIGELTIVGTFVGAVFAGERQGRFLGGAGSWGKLVAERHYHNDAQVKVSQVLADLATATGETVETSEAGSTRLATDFTQVNEPAADILTRAVGRVWWVDYDGITHVVARTEVEALPESYRVLEFDTRRQIATLDVEDLTAVGVGTKLSVGTVRTLFVDVVDGVRTVTVWVGGTEASTSPMVDAFVEAVEAVLAKKRLGVFRYRVVALSDVRLMLQPVNTKLGLPTLSNIELWSAPGYHADMVDGAEVAVAFLDGDFAVILGCRGAYDGGKFSPDKIHIGGMNGAAFAKVGDVVSVSMPPSMPFSGVLGVVPLVGVLTPLVTMTGSIQGPGVPRVLGK